jgi:hypothetical protein
MFKVKIVSHKIALLPCKCYINAVDGGQKR